MTSTHDVASSEFDGAETRHLSIKLRAIITHHGTRIQFITSTLKNATELPAQPQCNAAHMILATCSKLARLHASQTSVPQTQSTLPCQTVWLPLLARCEIHGGCLLGLSRLAVSLANTQWWANLSPPEVCLLRHKGDAHVLGSAFNHANHRLDLGCVCVGELLLGNLQHLCCGHLTHKVLVGCP